ncbi:MAG: hypothetical protein H0V86_12990 [Chloroflexia bacterium]|nr:hypothetical protein [Chloroflexia bacterium]
MRRHTAARLAWSLSMLTLVSAAGTVFLVALNAPDAIPDMLFAVLLILTFAIVGALVASRHPHNRIGWLFCIGALIWIVGEFTLEYAVYALITEPGSLPAGRSMSWFGTWARGFGWLLLATFLLLLFPTGRLPSRRWRYVGYLAIGNLVLFTAVSVLSPTSTDMRLSFVTNPLGLELDRATMDMIEGLAYAGYPFVAAACGAAVVRRFRHARGEEREQLKWFVFAVALMVLLMSSGLAAAVLRLIPGDALLFTLPMAPLPVATGVAILKYRLYDIDLIIRRTLVYGALTASLAAVYFGGVAAIQAMLRAITGQESSVAVVASTLAIAALFQPLRRRVQGFIDRRFYRGKYDAARTLQAYSAHLRDEVDLDALNGRLIGVVNETVQPAHVSLWLRERGPEPRSPTTR